MSIVYGRKPLARNPILLKYFSRKGPEEEETCTINNVSYSQKELKDTDYFEFYQNRFARVMPTYYLCMLLATPVAFLGCLSWETDNIKGLIGALFMGTFPIASITNFFWEIPINGPSWTVQTLLFFWFVKNANLLYRVA